MDQQLKNWLKTGSLIEISKKNQFLASIDVDRANEALTSEMDWICLEGCFALIRHQQQSLEPRIIQIIGKLYLRNQKNIPLIGNLLRAFMSLPPSLVVCNQDLSRIVYASAESDDSALRANATLILTALAAEGDVRSKRLIGVLRDDSDETVRINARLQ